MTVNLDKVRLAKILSRTQSDSAGEVFAAMTIANRMLREANTSWDILLVGKANPRSKAGVVRGGTATPPPWAKGAVSMGVREQIEYLLSSKTLASATRIWVTNIQSAVVRAAGQKRYEEEPLGRFLSARDQRILADLVHEETKRRSGT